jgi:hypothetical protein
MRQNEVITLTEREVDIIVNALSVAYDEGQLDVRADDILLQIHERWPHLFDDPMLSIRGYVRDLVSHEALLHAE